MQLQKLLYTKEDFFKEMYERSPMTFVSEQAPNGNVSTVIGKVIAQFWPCEDQGAIIVRQDDDPAGESFFLWWGLISVSDEPARCTMSKNAFGPGVLYPLGRFQEVDKTTTPEFSTA